MQFHQQQFSYHQIHIPKHMIITRARISTTKFKIITYFYIFLDKRRVASKELGYQNVLKREKEKRRGTRTKTSNKLNKTYRKVTLVCSFQTFL